MDYSGYGEGSIFFRTDRKKWIAQYMDYDVMKDKSVKRCRSFNTKEEAKKFLDTIMYQRENPIYIEKNGLPLYDLMMANLKNKKDATEKERGMAEKMSSSYDISDIKYIEPIVSYLLEKDSEKAV